MRKAIKLMGRSALFFRQLYVGYYRIIDEAVYDRFSMELNVSQVWEFMGNYIMSEGDSSKWNI